MKFEVPIDSSVRFTRIDTGASVDVYYHPERIPGDPLIQELMPEVLYSSIPKIETQTSSLPE